MTTTSPNVYYIKKQAEVQDPESPHTGLELYFLASLEDRPGLPHLHYAICGGDLQSRTFADEIHSSKGLSGLLLSNMQRKENYYTGRRIDLFVHVVIGWIFDVEPTKV